jgi:hypothetical protein
LLNAHTNYFRDKDLCSLASFFSGKLISNPLLVCKKQVAGTDSFINKAAKLTSLPSIICFLSIGDIISMNGKEEDGTPFIVAVAELLARFKP